MKKLIFTMAFAAIAYLGYSQSAPAGSTQTTPAATSTAGSNNKMAPAKAKPAQAPAAAAKPAATADKPTGEKTKTGEAIYMGPKGGKYYMKDGKKVYIKQTPKTGGAAAPKTK